MSNHQFLAKKYDAWTELSNFKIWGPKLQLRNQETIAIY